MGGKRPPNSAGPIGQGDGMPPGRLVAAYGAPKGNSGPKMERGSQATSVGGPSGPMVKTQGAPIGG